jgi:23S rRNA (uridine2552-2'-O)-methyltransferase
MNKGNRWDDHYARRAKNEKWLARSVYKLEEIDRRHKLLRQGATVLDLGCYPGSWSQYSLRKVGLKGEVAGIDLQEPDRLGGPNFRFVQGNVLTLDLDTVVQFIGPRDVVISDLAPNTTGVALADVSRSMELAERALTIALKLLKKGGHLLCKVFEGEDFKTLRNEFALHFNAVHIIRPAAVRKRSREVYLLGLHLQKDEQGPLKENESSKAI